MSDPIDITSPADDLTVDLALKRILTMVEVAVPAMTPEEIVSFSQILGKASARAVMQGRGEFTSDIDVRDRT